MSKLFVCERMQIYEKSFRLNSNFFMPALRGKSQPMSKGMKRDNYQLYWARWNYTCL